MSEIADEGESQLLRASFKDVSPQDASKLVRGELDRGADGPDAQSTAPLSQDATRTLFVCVASSMNGEQLAAVMPGLSGDHQRLLLDAIDEFGSLDARGEFANRWNVETGTPKLAIKEHISTDVLWPTLTKFTPSEIRSLLSQKPGVPSEFTQRTAPALQKTAANFTPLAQVKDVFKRDVTTAVLAEPAYRAAAEHWALEAGGVTAEMIETSGALGWWVPQTSAALATLNYREKFGLAYANAEFSHGDFGTARASLSSGTQLFAWGVASVNPTGWDVGAFAGAEAVGLKVAAQYQSPVLAMPGTLGIVKTQFSVAGDLNLGAAGGDIGLGARGSTDGGQFSLYGQIGFSPGIGWRVLPILDVSVDVEKVAALGKDIGREYESDPARKAVERTLASGGVLAAVTDPGQVLGGLYLGAALRVAAPQVVDELSQWGRDLGDGLEMLAERTNRWLGTSTERP